MIIAKSRSARNRIKLFKLMNEAKGESNIIIFIKNICNLKSRIRK